MRRINYGQRDMQEDDIKAVNDVLRSEFLTQGPAVPSFETAVATGCNAKHAIAVNSATSALHLACLALNVGEGDIVWTSTVTFVATSNAALYCGADIDFVDIDKDTYNISIERLKEKLEAAEAVGKLPTVLIAVHLTGQSAQMAEAYSLGQKYGFKIIEDASHAVGAKYKGKAVGDCQFSDITVFSFHPVKIITSGEGGMLLMNDDLLAERARYLRTHGITGDKALMEPQRNTELWNYQQISIGFNYRMSDIHAALGRSQFGRTEDFVNKRQRIAAEYNQRLADLPVRLPFQHEDTRSSFHLYVIRLNLDEININKVMAYQLFQEKGVLVNFHYIPVYRHPYYANRFNFKPEHFPESECYFLDALSIPMHSQLCEEDIEYTSEVVKDVVFSKL